jgi:hypothetical protein
MLLLSVLNNFNPMMFWQARLSHQRGKKSENSPDDKEGIGEHAKFKKQGAAKFNNDSALTCP